MIVAPALALLLAAGSPAAGATAVTMAVESPPDDTLWARARARESRRRRSTVVLGAVIPGHLSPRGLPPRPGEFVVTDTGLVFRTGDGRTQETYALVGPVRMVGSRRWRASTVSLAYVDQDAGRTMYVFRLDGGVFHTDRPGALLEVVDRPAWLDSVASREWRPDRPLLAPGDTAGARRLTGRLTQGSYADTLFALFGRPQRAVGQVGKRGRQSGRLGEYLASRDSLALDAARMTSEDQLRHTLAHELGHRWQARAPGQLAVLWQDVPPIRDPRRYGHGNTTEHQAEAIAFAVHFLQTTAAAPAGADPAPLLEPYERMVPGTGVVARWLALQPVYAGHPLRVALTRGVR